MAGHVNSAVGDSSAGADRGAAAAALLRSLQGLRLLLPDLGPHWEEQLGVQQVGERLVQLRTALAEQPLGPGAVAVDVGRLAATNLALLLPPAAMKAPAAAPAAPAPTDTAAASAWSGDGGDGDGAAAL
eukprot:XP_001701343.1 predicted protein [Chlamydomonas reinhardtii]